jgi:hypothetical protein
MSNVKSKNRIIHRSNSKHGKVKRGKNKIKKKQSLISPPSRRAGRRPKNKTKIINTLNARKSHKNASTNESSQVSSKFLSRAKDDELLRLARSNLNSKIQHINIAKRKLVSNEKEKAALLSTLLGQDALAPAQAAINLTNVPPPPQTTTAVPSEPKVGAKRRRVHSFAEISSADEQEDDIFVDTFSTPKQTRFSVSSNPYHARDEAEKELDTPHAKRNIKSALKNSTPLVKKYLNYFNDTTERKYLDLSNTGIKIINGNFFLGNCKITFNKNKIILDGDTKFEATAGLMELLMFKQPDQKQITDADYDTYRKILVKSNAHKQKYSDEFPIAGNRGNKYRQHIAHLFNKEATGSGVLSKLDEEKTVYKYFDSANQLVNR